MLELGCKWLFDAAVLILLDRSQPKRNDRRRGWQRAHAVAPQPTTRKLARGAQVGNRGRVHAHLRLKAEIGIAHIGGHCVQVLLVSRVDRYRLLVGPFRHLVRDLDGRDLGPVVVLVRGVLDPLAVGRQVEGALRDHRRGAAHIVEHAHIELRAVQELLGQARADHKRLEKVGIRPRRLR